MDLNKLKDSNSARWAGMNVTPSLEHTIDSVAHRLIAAKTRYQGVQDKTGVPWAVIAVIHEREASQRWDANIAQGDKWNQVSIHVPRGRGPFSSWEEAAYDALVNCAPKAALWHDWSIGGALTLLEQYNGLGYASRGLPSPYIWASTDRYVKGKYVSDGKFDPDAVDHQMGCAALLARMMVLDPSIHFDGVNPAPVAEDDTTKQVKDLQRRLGFKDSEIDGVFGAKTETAVKAYQKAHGLPETGEVDARTWAVLG